MNVQFGNVTPPPQRLTEQQRDRDLPAYWRLRQQGLQPKMTRGCAELEARAHSQFEIDHHKLVETNLWKKTKNVIEDVQMAVQEARDANYTVADVKDWKEKRDAG